MVNLNIPSEAKLLEPKPAFVEVQRLRRIWIMILLGLTLASLIMAAAHPFLFMQSASERLLSLPAICFVAVLLLLFTLLFHKAHLITRLDENGVHYRFFPFQFAFRSIRWRDMGEVYIREYDALSEYGGWGVKIGSQGRAYSIRGRYGLQMELPDGRRILIGTQRPIEMERLILNYLYDYEAH